MDVGIDRQKSKGKDEQADVGIESESEREIYGQSITKRGRKRISQESNKTAQRRTDEKNRAE